jgi:hypothetical protein
MKLQAVLLGLALERLPPYPGPDGRRVRMAEAAFTTLHGAGQMAAAAPGFTEPFHIVSVCERLPDLDFGDRWGTPPIVPRARPADEPWSPPRAFDLLRREPVDSAGDGVVAVIGLHRLAAAEDALRAAPPGAEVTAALVTADPGELLPLVRLAVAELRGFLHEAVPSPAWPRLRIVCDETGALAEAAGVTAVSDATETAVRIEGGRIVGRSAARSACA